MSYAKGIDISRYNIIFDPSKATQHIDFIFQKATQGTTYIDLLYEQLWQGVSQTDIRGAYHYQVSNESWKAQADHFLNTVARHDYHILALDLEGFGNTYSDTFFADTKRIIDYWRFNAPSKSVALYTNGDGYKQLYYSLLHTYGSSIIKWMDELPLWFASPTTAGFPFLPTIRKTWEIHQYSWGGLPDDWGTGGTRVDLNVFNGTVEQMLGWLGLAPYSSSVELLFNNALKYEKRTYTSPRPITCHIAEIDTSKSYFIITPPKTNGLLDPQKTSEFASRYNIDLATNGDEGYLVGNEFQLIRREMSAGKKYGIQTDGITTSFSKDKPYQIETISGPFPEFAYNAISGSRWLMKDGQRGNFIDDLPAEARTLLGYSQDRGKCFIVIINEKTDSLGMTLLESYELMRGLGCYDAVNLDGGGSSTMVIRGKGVVNIPSDSSGERYVANHIGIIFDKGDIMTATHKVWSTLYNMTLRPEHNTGAVGTESVSVNTLMLADEIWTATADLYKIINGVNTKINAIGDSWAHIISVDGVAKNSWAAVVHLGKIYCNVEEIITPPSNIVTTNISVTWTDNVTTEVKIDGETWIKP